MARRRHSSRTRRKVMKVVYTIFAAFVLGYFPAYWLLRSGGPQISMVALALLVVPFAATARSVLNGLLLGLAIGFWGGLSTAYAIIHQGAVSNRLIAASMLGTTLLCAAVGIVFAHMAKKRAERAESQWR